MTGFNKESLYLERTIRSGKPSNGVGVRRDWWFVKWSNGSGASIPLTSVHLPKEYLGKKVRFKVEVLEA